jgi:hypothetical protein
MIKKHLNVSSSHVSTEKASRKLRHARFRLRNVQPFFLAPASASHKNKRKPLNGVFHPPTCLDSGDRLDLTHAHVSRSLVVLVVSLRVQHKSSKSLFLRHLFLIDFRHYIMMRCERRATNSGVVQLYVVSVLQPSLLFNDTLSGGRRGQMIREIRPDCV